MRKILLFVAVLWSFGLRAQQGFVRNDGQWEDPSKFVYRFGANAVFLTKDSIVFSILDPKDQHNHDAPQRHHYADTLHYVNFSLKFPGAHAMNWQGIEAYDHTNHFYQGHRSRWRTNVPSFHTSIAEDVYPGIDLKVYSTVGGMKYDWVVHPGADPSQIIQEYGGVEGLEVLPKKVKIQTAIGTLKEEMPYAYQGKNEVRARYQKGRDQVRIKLSDYDHSKPLIIDPVYIFSTYSGSQADNFGYTATFDDNGNAFGGGIVFGVGYPVSLGAVDTAFSGGAFDIGVSKFSADGSQLLWSSYLGGNGVDQPHSLECDEFGNLYIFGVTGSSDFATTLNAFDTTFGGGLATVVDFVSFSDGTDAFLSKINSSGDSLLASTYLGGASNEGINENLGYNYGDGFRGEIEVQRDGGNVYVVSSCNGNDYPISSQGKSYIGGQDGVISIFNRDLDTLVFGSYIGSKGDDALYSLALAEKNGNSTNSTRLFLAGSTFTDSSFVYLGEDSIQINIIGDQSGLLVAAYFDGSVLQMLATDATFDPGYDQHYFVEVNHMSDTSSLVTVMGQNKGGIVAADSLIWGQPGSTQYFRQYKYNPNTLGFDEKKTSVWGSGQSTTIDISPTALLIDLCGNLYFSGWGGSPNYEGSTFDLWTSSNAPQDSTDGRDFYFIVLNKGWKSAEIATFWGGTGREHVDGGTSRFDAQGRIFQAVCAGCGGNSDYPTFPQNVYSNTNNSLNCNLAITVIDLDVQFAKNKVESPLEICFPDSLILDENSENVDLWNISWGDGTLSDSLGDAFQHFYNSPGTYDLIIVGLDTICNSTDTTKFQVTINPPYDSVWIDYSYDYCDPSRQVVATARLVSDSSIVTGYELEWDFAGVNFSSALVQFNMPVPGANPVRLSVLDTNCNITQLFEDTLVFRIPPFLQINAAVEECETRESVDFNAILNATYQGFEWLVDGQIAGNSNPLQISQSGIYDISIVGYDSICGTSDTLTESFDVYFTGEAFTVPNFITPNNDGVNDAFMVNTGENWDEFHLIVHNRWGVKVFETNVVSFEWQADYDDKILTPGVYFYQLKATNRCGDITEDGVLHIMY